MPSTTVQSLSRATTATFEELALLFPEHELSPEQAAAPLDVAVSVEFRGPLRGRLVLRATSSILSSIAANMLGEDASRQRPLQRDALGEIANVICGNVLPVIAGVEAVFHLSAPHVHEGVDVVSRDDDAPSASIMFGVEDGRAEAVLYFFGERDGAEPLSQGAVSAA
ncbi:chemotaxis protein CheX [Gemmatimonas sp.]|uniref:chemotaxis protein CheX n=1 Tax=Gemmatimonas sp. TaxID=1962908 RepID=UPI00286C4534|nr:chemotaxis protein CheX [Gemmatimonas sp.]